MPRTDRNRSLPLSYRASPPPEPGSTLEQVIRATWDEFTKITSGLSDYDRPVSLSVYGADTIGVYVGTPIFDRQLNGITPIWQKPGGSWNLSNGQWTCPQEGLYLITGSIVSAPFPAPATKSYSVLADIGRVQVETGTTVTYSFAGGGLDDQNVTCSFSLLLPLVQADRIYLNGAGKHPSVSGGNNVTSYLTITRQAGLGNNAD